ncbi:PA26 p53-induced protein-domain-containing protein [Syncephalastrum racemosum]|uniref:PA26 p53-induced protein-domain-containing protein n=1 Tax=Syncephalastrum racemosum TaxID=13706 RepID=A0A1X2HQZ2_SYNRA|nr:PA26 p53-induced protein-domain-containing protein [Syncephalastrum racemosum]
MNHNGLTADAAAYEEIARDTRARQLQAYRLREALFKGLQVESPESPEDRQEALEKILQVVKSFVRVARSPFSSSSPNTPPSNAESPLHNKPDTPTNTTHFDLTELATHQLLHDEDAVGGADEQLQYFLLTMLRLSLTCPFKDVRHTFKHFLQTLKANGITPTPQARHLSPSYFIHLDDIFSLETKASRYTTVQYPRPGNISYSPWSADENTSNDTVEEGRKEEQDEQEDCAKTGSPEEASTTGGRAADEYVRQMLVKTYIDEGRLANVFRVIAFFPTYYEIYHTTYSKTIKSSIGPLPRVWRIYLAILVAAQQRCQYLVSLLKLEFLHVGGDPAWLKGLAYCPPKLRPMSRLILVLARQPWRLSEDDIRALMSNTVGSALGESWSKGELVQAVVVIATFLGLSSFVLGCGIAPELDMCGGFSVTGGGKSENKGVEHELDTRTTMVRATEDAARAAASHATGWYDSNIAMDNDDDPASDDAWIATDDTTPPDDDSTRGQHSPINQDDFEQTTELISKLKLSKDSDLKQELLESLEGGEADTGQRKLSIKTSRSVIERPRSPVATRSLDGGVVYDDLSRYVDPVLDESIEIKDFDDEERQHYEEFMLGDYCYEDHGYELVNQFLPDLGEDLVEEFDEAQSITDWSIFHQVTEAAVDTSPLRYAIWYRVQQILGIVKDDYNYDDISRYLSRRTSEYIKKVCQQPDAIRRTDWSNIGLSLRPEEKCHVNLLVASARKQALLCYGLSILATL